MRKAAAVLGLTSVAVAFGLLLSAEARWPMPSGRQENVPPQVQRPKYDYNSSFLSRSTQALGLKEDPAVRKMLNQSAVKWAIRAGARQILD